MADRSPPHPSALVDHPPADLRAGLITMLATVALGTLAYAVVPMRGERAWIGGLVAVAALGLLVPLTVRRIRGVATSDRPILDAAAAIVFLLTLLIYGFAGVFVALAERPDQLVGVETKIDAVYFTVTTLGTVGYGDAHAVGQAARVIVTLQILFDLAFLALAVRLLAGIVQRRVGQRPPPPA